MTSRLLKTALLTGVFLTAQTFAHSHSHTTGQEQSQSGFRLPSLSHQAPNFNEQWQNRLIANWSLQHLNGSMPQILDPYVVERLFNLTASMNAQVRSQALLAVPVIHDNAINAFAVPGGLIGINTGTILSAKSQDEFASVLAHEVAHLSQRHYEHNKDNKNKLLALQLGGLLTAIALSAVSKDGGTAMLLGSQALVAESATAHSREHEREADRVGMQILAGAGYDVRAMPRFFARLHREHLLHTGSDSFIPSFVRSHPLTAERLSETTNQANAYPVKYSPDRHAKAFDLLVWRLKYLTKAVDLTELANASKVSLGAKLAYIAQLADLRRFDEANAVFASIPHKDKDSDPLYCITAGHIFYERGDFAKAVEILSACHAVYPERTDLKLYLADSLVQAGDDVRAEKLLLPFVKDNEHHTLAWDLLQKNYEHRSQKSTNPLAKAIADLHALRCRGKKELWTGSYEKALGSFATAQTIAKAQNQAGLLALLEKDSEQVRTYRDLKVK